MERQFFSGNTLEQAVLAAGRHYDLDPDRVAYKLRDKKHGFLNMRRRVVIEVDPTSPALPEETPVDHDVSAIIAGDPEPGRASPEHLFRDRQHHEAPEHLDHRGQMASWRGEESSWDGGDGADDTEAVEKAIEELSDLMEICLAPSIQRGQGGLEIELSGSQSEMLRESGGAGLNAIEHLLPRMARGLTGHGVPCRVDSEGFRASQEEDLRQLAQGMAEEVCRERQAKRLELMNPAERRLVHLALADDPTVRTESEGTGFLKRVMIIPS